jgi:proteasome lid subunit RPN8/RPN11
MKPEVGYLVCRHGRVYLRENETVGEEHNIDISTHCSQGQPVALVHTHNVNPDPSALDIQTSKEKGLKVCVDFHGKVKCYRGK